MQIRERDKPRREIDASVAEGSMTPEEGERLLNAGKAPGKTGRCGSIARSAVLDHPPRVSMTRRSSSR